MATGSVSNPLRYAGLPWNGSTGLTYMRARYYDPGLGRFISEDPLGLSAGLNPYVYVGNSPTNGTDPSGLCAWSYSYFHAAPGGGPVLHGWGKELEGCGGTGGTPAAAFAMAESISLGNMWNALAITTNMNVGGQGSGSIGTSAGRAYDAGTSTGEAAPRGPDCLDASISAGVAVAGDAIVAFSMLDGSWEVYVGVRAAGESAGRALADAGAKLSWEYIKSFATGGEVVATANVSAYSMTFYGKMDPWKFVKDVTPILGSIRAVRDMRSICSSGN